MHCIFDCTSGKRPLVAVCALVAAFGGHTGLAAQPVRLPRLTVNSKQFRKQPLFNKSTIGTNALLSASGPGTASLVQRLPGAALIDNGAVSGQVEYRGMFGPRMNVMIDGMHIDPGGPNWMDSPLRYAPKPELSSLTLIRGVAPVSAGIETEGGTVIATSKQSHFSDSKAFAPHGSVTFLGRSVDNGLGGGGVVSLANEDQRLELRGSAQRGRELDFGDGTISDSRYQQSDFGAGYGFRLGRQNISLHYQHFNTPASGNPPFPLDIQFIHTDILRLDYDGRWRGVDWQARAYNIHVNHAMDNYTLRPTPNFNAMMPGPDQRKVPAQSNGLGLDVSGTFNLWGGRFTLGQNDYLANNNSRVIDPQGPRFKVVAFNNAERDLYSVFAQWHGQITTADTLNAGARYTRVSMNAGRGSVAPGLPAPAQQLTQSFNAQNHARNDDNVDLAVKFTHALNSNLGLQLGLGRKTRSPSYIERYAYIPLEATAGLADLNNYVGNVNLKPEAAYEADLGLNWHTNRFELAPRIFFRRVENYIEGTAVDATPGVVDSDVERVSRLNGDPTPLRFTNVGAKFFGMDISADAKLSHRWLLSSSLNYTRGLRTDISDNIYRVAPFHGNLTLSYTRNQWQVSAEERFATSQSAFSRSKLDPRVDNPETAGYALLDLSTQYYWPRAQMTISGGIRNIFDRTYKNFLSGYNRIRGSDVGVGERIPGAGRSVFLQVTQTF